MSDKDIPIGKLILVPAVITLGVTLLRLFGELQGWSERFFNRAPGGGGAIVGIAWLVFVFGAYFGWKLTAMGHGPASGWRAAGAAGLGLLVVVLVVVAVNLLKVPPFGQLFIIAVASWVGVVLAMRGWRALGRVLLAYALAARIPVALVMLAAILGNWGTHYDVVPPDFPAMSGLTKWFLIGVLPQLSAWIVYTVVFGVFFGLLGAALARRAAQPAVA